MREPVESQQWRVAKPRIAAAPMAARRRPATACLWMHATARIVVFRGRNPEVHVIRKRFPLFLAFAILPALAACTAPQLPGVRPSIRWVDKRVIVKFRPAGNAKRIEQARVRVGAQTWRRLPEVDADLLLLDGSVDVPAALHALGSDYSDVVEFAEPDFLYSTDSIPSDYDAGVLWGLARVNAPAAWEISAGSRDVTVAVLDTGVDVNHPDLAANLWSDPREEINGDDDDGDGYVDDRQGWNFVDGTPDPVDRVSHGTHVAGTIGAVGGNGGIVGMSPRVSILPLETIGPEGGTTSDAIAAIAYARMHGARIINASWGSRAYSNALRTAIRKAGDDGVLFVAAAGNGDSRGIGEDADLSPSFPAAFDLPNILSVAASDRDDALAEFSNFGRTTVDLAAPGVSILSTIPGGGYARYDGTSMAAPHVSGAAALLLASYPDLPLSELRAALVDSVRHVASMDGRLASNGRLDVLHALAYADDAVAHRQRLSSRARR